MNHLKLLKLKTIKEVQKETGIKGKQLFMPIRVAVTGQMHGPELPNTIEVLGKEKVLSRLKNMLNNVNIISQTHMFKLEIL